MARDFTLYWSSLEKYEECPRKFLWYRGYGDIDLGRGPGRGKPIPVKKSEHHALMGTVIQAVVEDLYNKEIWREFRGLALRQHLEALTFEHFDKSITRFHIEWGPGPMCASNRMELLQVCLEGVRGWLVTMKANQLLGVFNACELDYKVDVGNGTRIGGRADLVIRREVEREVHPGVSIIDGKNSKSKGKYTSPDQVRWYALCFYLEHGVMPDRVGFAYYRYPHGMPIEGKPGEVEQGVDWVPFTMADLEGLAHRARMAHQGMRDGAFDPTPKPPTCKFCEFETVCPERLAQKEKNRRRRKPKPLSPELAEKIGGGGTDGFFEL